MLKNKAVIAIVLLLFVAAIAYNIHFFYKRMHPESSSSSGKVAGSLPPGNSQTPTTTPSAKPSVSTASPTAEKKQNSADTASFKKKRPLLATGWGRNPFFSPVELAQLANIEGKKKTASEKKVQEIPVTLSGIILVSKDKMAILNNRVMAEGEKIGNIKLLRILPSAVWITVGNKRRWVPLPQPRITLIAQEVVGSQTQHTPKEKGK